MTTGEGHMHDCAAKGCKVRVGRELLACRKHWAELPYPVKQRVLRTWAVAKYGPKPMQRYLLARAEAVAYWAGLHA